MLIFYRLLLLLLQKINYKPAVLPIDAYAKNLA